MDNFFFLLLPFPLLGGGAAWPANETSKCDTVTLLSQAPQWITSAAIQPIVRKRLRVLMRTHAATGFGLQTFSHPDDP